MKRDCAVCAEPLALERYRFGAVRGVLCPGCARSLGVVLTDWMQHRMRELEAERTRRARTRLRKQLELETLPVVARRPVAGRT